MFSDMKIWWWRGEVAQSVERLTPVKEVVGLILAVATRSLLVVSVLVLCGG